MTDIDPDILRGPWKALIVHEGWIEDDFSELNPDDEVDIVIVRGTCLPDDEGRMPGTYKSGDMAFNAEDIYVDGEGDPNTAAPGVYARAQAMAAGLNAAAEADRYRDAVHHMLALAPDEYRQTIVAARAAGSGSDYAKNNGRAESIRTFATGLAERAGLPVIDWEQIKRDVPADGVYRTEVKA